MSAADPLIADLLRSHRDQVSFKDAVHAVDRRLTVLTTRADSMRFVLSDAAAHLPVDLRDRAAKAIRRYDEVTR